MKKILSIALIAALISTAAFAELTGSAEIKFGTDLDAEVYGFVNEATTKLTWGYTFESATAGNAGEGDLKAAIEGSFAIDIKSQEYKKGDTLAIKVSDLGITKAEIICKDMVTVDILGPGDSADFATAYYKANAVKKTDATKTKGYTVDAAPSLTAFVSDVMDLPYGFGVSAAGYQGGFGINGNYDGDVIALGYGITPSYTLAEGLTAQGAIALYDAKAAADNVFVFAGNGKVGYKKDLLSANIAADIDVIKFSTLDDSSIVLEVAADAKYDFVSAYAYFFSYDKFDTINFDAKLAAEKEISGVTLTASVDGRDLFDDGQMLFAGDDDYFEVENEREVTAALDASTKIDAISVSGGVSYGFYGKTLGVTASATYTADMFVASAGVEVAMGFDPDFACTKIAPTASISSDKVINGATVSLSWTDADLADGADNPGKIYASAKIEF